jgi:hypothetical protein
VSPSCQAVDQTGLIQTSDERFGEGRKPREFLLKVDLDASEKNLSGASIRLVRADRCVDWDKKAVLTLANERFGNRIIIHAATAEHASGTCGQIDPSHDGQSRPFKSILLQPIAKNGEIVCSLFPVASRTRHQR